MHGELAVIFPMTNAAAKKYLLNLKMIFFIVFPPFL
jgi:hypothetical protein